MSEQESSYRKPSDVSPPPYRADKKMAVPHGCGAGIVLILIALVFLPLFVWFGCRIEPRSGELAVLIRKTGTDLPDGRIIAANDKEKGILPEVLSEGRYFKNPLFWGWRIHRIVDIQAGKLGVKTRLYGEDLPPGRIIAEDGRKGIVAEVLRPGKYRINPYAYRVELYDAVTIRPGHVGVITSLTGQDVLHPEDETFARNSFLVTDTMKGVISRVLDPGTYYLNPYIYNIVEVNLQSQRFEMSGKDVINFLTQDGFTVTVEGTIEFSIMRDKAALMTHRVGDMEDVIMKVILPRARGFSRIEGSKHPAIDFIVGETRQAFQQNLDTHLRKKCEDWGVSINSVLVRKIIVPDAIASINRDREVAVQDARKYEQQIEQAKSKAELVKQEWLAVQNREKVQAETERIRAVINAREDEAVRVISAEKDLGVAKHDLEAAAFTAEAVMLTARGESDAVRARNEAEASVLQDQVTAFGSGLELARYTFYGKVAPRIVSILSSDVEEGLGSIMTPLLPDVNRGGK